MFVKALSLLPLAFALIAAKAAPPPAAPPMPSLAAPAEVAANPANKLTLDLSNGGTVVIQMRPTLRRSTLRAFKPWSDRDSTTASPFIA